MERILKEPKKLFPGEGKNSFYDVYDTTAEEVRECKEMLGMKANKTFAEFCEEMKKREE